MKCNKLLSVGRGNINSKQIYKNINGTEIVGHYEMLYTLLELRCNAINYKLLSVGRGNINSIYSSVGWQGTHTGGVPQAKYVKYDVDQSAVVGNGKGREFKVIM